MRIRLFVLFCVSCTLFSKAQRILDLHSGQESNELVSTVPTRDVEEVADGYLITYTFKSALILPDTLFPGTVFWKVDGFGMNETPGEPCTLGRTDMIAIPRGFSARVELVDSVYVDYAYELTPARQPLVNSSDEEYTRQNVLDITQYRGRKPATIVSQSEDQFYRGLGICQVMVSPVQYDYSSRTVRAYKSITYKVSFASDGSEARDHGAFRRYFSQEDNFLANNVIGGVQNEAHAVESSDVAMADVRDYLILSTNTYSEAVNRFAEWKRLMGFNVHVVLRDDWTSALVKSTVSDAYSRMPALYYLLIIGDHEDVPAQQSYLEWEHVTDFYYGCMDEDCIPEIYCGRLSVSTAKEANTVVEKVIGYEQAPPTSSRFYDNGLHCAYFQDNNNDGYEDCRFTQTSEDIRTYVMSQGKSIQRLYSAESDVTPLYWNKYLYSNGEAIPDELKKPNFSWKVVPINIWEAINDGVFYVMHQDHGGVSSWSNPSFTTYSISQLSNGDLLPVVFSINCRTGKFDERCFSETFLRKSNGGCVAIYGASEVTITGYNDALSVGMFDAIWPNPGLAIKMRKTNNSFSMTPAPTYALGQILRQGMVRLAESYSSTNKWVRYTNEVYHCFGDPSMKIYTEMPTEFTNVSIVRNESSVSVNIGNDVARITAYNPISGEVQSYIGNSVTIPTPNPDEAIICVSGHNRIPFIQKQDVMYIQNANITGTLDETHDVIKVGKNVTSTISEGNVTTSGADITLKAKRVLLDSGTHISVGSKLRITNP